MGAAPWRFGADVWVPKALFLGVPEPSCGMFGQRAGPQPAPAPQSAWGCLCLRGHELQGAATPSPPAKPRRPRCLPGALAAGTSLPLLTAWPCSGFPGSKLGALTAAQSAL